MLSIQTTPAKLKTSYSRPPMRIDQGFSEMKILKTGTDHLSISSKAAKLHIDQSKAFAEANLKKITALTKEWAEQGKAQAMNYAAVKAQEGNQLAKIEKGVTIATMVRQKFAPRPPSSNIEYMPHSVDRVRIYVEPGQLNFTAPNARISVEVDSNAVNVDIPKWQVDTQLVQKNDISFTVHTHE